MRVEFERKTEKIWKIKNLYLSLYCNQHSYIMDNKELVGKRVRCLRMENDPHPIESGTEGTVIHVGGGIINVNWDNGRSLGLVEGEDQYMVL